MIETNKDKLVKIAVLGEIVSPTSGPYRTTWDGKPKMSIGGGGIKYNLKVGDPCFGWANGDHVEPGVVLQGKEKPSPGDCALPILSCIGNEAVVMTGDAAGAKGFYVGRHAGAHDMVWFPDEVLEKLCIGDKVQVKACGVGLKIKGFEDVKVNKCDPSLLEKLGIIVESGKLVVPVVGEFPGFLMGSGIGSAPIVESVDYDIQTTCPDAIKKYGIDKLRLGDVVALKDQYDVYGRGYYKNALTVGVVIHGMSDYSGHGPGVDPILSTKDGKIVTRIEPNANIAYYLGIRKPK